MGMFKRNAGSSLGRFRCIHLKLKAFGALLDITIEFSQADKA
ncbi:hypothetical protein [Celerinatantimonas sp. MCCC 1A17872]